MQSYSWQIENGAGDKTTVAVLAKGYNEQGKEQWYGLDTSGKGNVPWGTSLAMPELKASSANPLVGAYITFAC